MFVEERRVFHGCVPELCVRMVHLGEAAQCFYPLCLAGVQTKGSQQHRVRLRNGKIKMQRLVLG